MKRARPALASSLPHPPVTSPSTITAADGYSLVAVKLPSGAPVDVYVKSAGGQELLLLFRGGAGNDAVDWVTVFKGAQRQKESGKCSSELRGMEFARLLFKSEAAVDHVLQLAPLHTASSSDPQLFGMKAWLAAVEKGASENQRDLQAEADESLAAFDAQEAAASQAVSDLGSRMDADGFTLVKRGVKPRPAATTIELALAAEQATNESDNAKRKRKRGSISKADFYAFQTREDKISKLKQLQERFDEDRERIRKLKAGRSFKPF